MSELTTLNYGFIDIRLILKIKHSQNVFFGNVKKKEKPVNCMAITNKKLTQAERCASILNYYYSFPISTSNLRCIRR